MGLSSPVGLEEGLIHTTPNPLITLDILKEYMRVDKYPKGFFYITNTLAWAGIVAPLRSSVWSSYRRF